jgi:hypothetical protein
MRNKHSIDTPKQNNIRDHEYVQKLWIRKISAKLNIFTRVRRGSVPYGSRCIKYVKCAFTLFIASCGVHTCTPQLSRKRLPIFLAFQILKIFAGESFTYHNAWKFQFSVSRYSTEQYILFLTTSVQQRQVKHGLGALSLYTVVLFSEQCCQ